MWSRNYLHSGSFSQEIGNPICIGLTVGYFINNVLKSATNVFFGSIAFSQYTMQHRIGYNLKGWTFLFVIHG